MIGGDIMLKAIKSYWAFTNIAYKLVMLGLIPILLIAINIYVYQNDVGSGMECFVVLFAIDTFSDVFFMGGIYSKKNGALEFLQSSPRFIKTIREITIVDIIRRILLYYVPYVTIMCCAVGDAETMEWLRVISMVPCIEILFAQMTVLVARHFLLWNYAYACTSAGYALMIFPMVVAVGIQEMDFARKVHVVFIVLTIIATVGTIWYTDKKMKESYYD